MKWILSVATALSLAVSPAAAASRKVCAECVTTNLQRLAGDGLRGRACGTADENAAARFIAQRFAAYKVAGGAADGGYLQSIEIRTPAFAAPPVLTVRNAHLVHGVEILALEPQEVLDGPLALVSAADAPATAAGKLAMLDLYDPTRANALFAAGAAAVIVPAPDQMLRAWDQIAARPPGATRINGVEPGPARPRRTLIFAKADAFAALRGQAGQTASFVAPRGEPRVRTTYNVLGVIHGRAPDADRQAILLSAHYDHVGVINGKVYPGANDDASGTVAVLEFARQLGAGKTPKRTVHFALFGCEEEGGHGAKYWLAQPPTPLANLAANLEFEMIGVPDPERPKTLMLTGWERSNLGPALKANGADIAPDRYPQENFFQRSDNYQLALKGVVAQTISAWPVPATYHQPTDTIGNLDMPFMLEVIQSLTKPVDWLLNSDFRPEWTPGLMP